MVGLSHGALRAVIREYTPPGVKTLWPTEMLNSRRVPEQIMGRTPETVGLPGEDGLAPQILGNEEKPIAQSVAKLIDWGAAAIDINMGCPVQKALRHNYGVALMGDPSYAADVVGMAVRNSSVPVSVKLRAGPQSADFDFLSKFVGGLRNAGASWVTLHPRTAEQGRRGSADWSQIKRLREVSDIPIIGNGDVQTADDVFAMLSQTNCDLVMSGRALAARPWMMWQVGERLGFAPPHGRHGPAPRTREEEGAEYGRALLRLMSYSIEMFGPDLALRKVRFHLRTTCPWLMFGLSLESLGHLAKSLDEFKPMAEDFFSRPQEMVAKTDLRQ